MTRLKLLTATSLSGLVAGPALAADMTVSVEVPRLSVASASHSRAIETAPRTKHCTGARRRSAATKSFTFSHHC